MSAAGWAIATVGVVVIAWAAMAYNRLVRLRNEALQAFSGIEVQLKRRADLVPLLVEVVQGYATHERTTLEAAAAARAAALAATGRDEVAAADGEARAAVAGLMALAEAYPDLKASDGFRQLAQQLAETEDRIAGARRYHNVVVKRLNTIVQSVPDLVVARAFGFREQQFYRPQDDAEREVPAT